MFSQVRIVKENNLIEPRAPISTFRAFRWSSETSDLCWKNPRIATCSLKSEDFGLWEIYRINLNKLTFNIKNTFLLTNKFPKLSCLRQNRLWMHVILLQIHVLKYLWKIKGYFLYFFYLIDELYQWISLRGNYGYSFLECVQI